MARKCTLKACRAELPSLAKSDHWQTGGFCTVYCKALHGMALVTAQKERKRKADEAGIKKRNSDLMTGIVLASPVVMLANLTMALMGGTL